MIKSFLLLSTLFSFSIFSQPTKYSKYVDTLCSNFFRGRGYVDNGHLKAAIFLSNEFYKIGIDSLNNMGICKNSILMLILSLKKSILKLMTQL